MTSNVHATPDRVTQNRVLAALVRGDEVLVPLRSMFEQMGATVNYDSATHTADVSKPGSDVKVTLGKPEVVINGDSRPLDVPPQTYRGSIMVPIRVISESMGAYVQWVPEKKVVVVRYLAQTAPDAAGRAPDRGSDPRRNAGAASARSPHRRPAGTHADADVGAYREALRALHRRRLHRRAERQ